MRVVEKDPRVPLRPYLLTAEREADMDRQVDEVISAMMFHNIFVNEADKLDKTVADAIAKLDKELTAKSKQPDEVERITRDMAEWEAVRRTPAQLADEKRAAIKAQAVDVLEKIHSHQMRGRLAQWQTTCRLDGCEKHPRTGLRPVQHKGKRRTFVFCPGHAGVRNMISKADYQHLKSNPNLRVVAR